MCIRKTGVNGTKVRFDQHPCDSPLEEARDVTSPEGDDTFDFSISLLCLLTTTSQGPHHLVNSILFSANVPPCMHRYAQKQLK